jgi:hypothetical protein
VTCHQQLCRQQGAIRGSKDQNVARHTCSFADLSSVATRARLKILVKDPRRCLAQIDRYDNHIAVLNFILCGAATGHCEPP